jgi:ubiquinone/menaquinone biosynthesis C-methylase UbiE
MARGVDLCSAMLETVRQRHPGVRFVQADVHEFDLGEKFDCIVCSIC